MLEPKFNMFSSRKWCQLRRVVCGIKGKSGIHGIKTEGGRVKDKHEGSVVSAISDVIAILSNSVILLGH